MGIPAAALPYVFDLFTQGDRAFDRAQGGLGIGLALVKKLVELHEGRVEALSAGPGQGSEFILRLPTGTGPPAAVTPPASQGPSVPPARMRVLVVDENTDSAESMAMLLCLQGHETRTALDGPAALEAAQVFRPELILLDIGLRGWMAMRSPAACGRSFTWTRPC